MSRNVFYSATAPSKVRGNFNTHLHALMRSQGEAAVGFRELSKETRADRLRDAFDRFGSSEDAAGALLAEFGFSPEHQEGSDRAREVSAAIAEAARKPARGLYLPLPGVSRRDLTVGAFADGGALAAEGLDGEIVEALAPFSLALSSGAKLVTGLMGGNFIIPRVAGKSAPSWVAEGAGSGSGDPTFDRVVIEPHTLCVKIDFTKRLEMARRSNSLLSLQQLLGEEIISSMMHELDRVILAGSGVGEEPLGLLGTSGVPVVSAGTNGAAPSWDILTEMEYQVGQQFAGNTLTWGFNAQTRRKLRRTPKGAGLDFIWSDGAPFGYNVGTTEHLPSGLTKGTGTNLSAAVLGDFSQVIVGFWGPRAVDVIVDAFTYRKSGTFRLVAFMEVGIGIRHPEGFAICKDLVTAV